MSPALAAAVSAYGLSLKSKLANPAIAGAPEDQLRGPLETLVRALSEAGGLPAGAVHLVGETTLAHLKTRPDYAVTVGNALAGFIEVKAPGKGADPRRFADPHNDQWARRNADLVVDRANSPAAIAYLPAELGSVAVLQSLRACGR